MYRKYVGLIKNYLPQVLYNEVKSYLKLVEEDDDNFNFSVYKCFETLPKGTSTVCDIIHMFLDEVKPENTDEIRILCSDIKIGKFQVLCIVK